MSSYIVTYCITNYMPRTIINISLPSQMADRVRKEVAKGHYASVSEFFRDLLRKHDEQLVLNDLRASQQEITTGKGKTLQSLKDLRA
jgi:Arc/MetJ-type ribon-helix-helix transcriptional regulator